MIPHHTSHTLKVSQNGFLNDISVSIMATAKMITGMVGTIKCPIRIFQPVATVKMELVMAISTKQKTVERALKELMDSGEIIKIGGGRYTTYTWNWEKE